MSSEHDCLAQSKTCFHAIRDIRRCSRITLLLGGVADGMANRAARGRDASPTLSTG